MNDMPKVSPESETTVTQLIDTIAAFTASSNPHELFKTLIFGDIPSDKVSQIIGFCVDVAVTANALELLPPEFLNQMIESAKEKK